MSTTIQRRAMPQALLNVAASAVSGGTLRPSEGLGFLDLAVLEAAKKNGDSAAEGLLSDRMTLQQYKKYISGRISAIQVDPSRALESLAVRISDAGFEAMKADPDYEAWVLGQLESAWSVPRAGISNAYTTYSIGETPEAFRTTTIEFDSASEELEQLDNETETFWERRHRHHEEYMELAQKEAYLRKLRNGTLSSAELLLGALL